MPKSIWQFLNSPLIVVGIDAPDLDNDVYHQKMENGVHTNQKMLIIRPVLL